MVYCISFISSLASPQLIEVASFNLGFTPLLLHLLIYKSPSLQLHCTPVTPAPIHPSLYIFVILHLHELSLELRFLLIQIHTHPKPKNTPPPSSTTLAKLLLLLFLFPPCTNLSLHWIPVQKSTTVTFLAFPCHTPTQYTVPLQMLPLPKIGNWLVVILFYCVTSEMARFSGILLQLIPLHHTSFLFPPPKAVMTQLEASLPASLSYQCLPFHSC